MRIRQNSQFANRHYLDEVCILNQNPRDVLGPWIESQTNEENDDFCGLASFGNTVKDLLREIAEAGEGKDKTENEQAAYCSFIDASGFKCGAEANAGSQYCVVHVQLPATSRTCSGTSKSKSRGKKVKSRQKRQKAEDSNRQKRKKAENSNRQKRKKAEDSNTGDEIVFYAGFPGLRRKRSCPQHRSEQEAAAVNNVDESH